MEKELFLDQYAYELPAGLIASVPAEPRDSSRLLVLEAKKGKIFHRTFRDLPDLLPKGALLVLNETKVVPARIVLTKSTGGKVEILFYTNLWDGAKKGISGISDRKIVPGQRLFSGNKELCRVESQRENVFEFELSVSAAEFLDALETKGVMPIPKYIREMPLSEEELKQKYQTVFARIPGSVAAPTASLHFTPDLFEKLSNKGIESARLSLHVGAGTFAPVTARELAAGELHEERFSIPKETLKAVLKAKREGRPVIPVGTTALRALESVGVLENPQTNISSSTRIFIRKPYSFKVADGLITNFHVPRSSLMCLVDAFLDYKKTEKGIMEIYSRAIEEKYRFFSFGDAMLVI